MVGYESITPQAPLIESVVPPENPSRMYLRRVRNMATAQGFTEVYNYSFVTEEMARAFHMDAGRSTWASRIRSRPIKRCCERACCRRFVKNILDNSRHFQSFRLFEIGREIHARDRELPEEIPHFAAAMYAREGDGSASRCSS